MSAFKNLKDACLNFEEEIRRVSTELFSVRIGESFEDGIAKKMRNLSLFTTKARLLRATLTSRTPQITEQELDKDTVYDNYAGLARSRIVEGQVVKSLTQAQAVRSLITAPSGTMDPELVVRKEKIIAALDEYRTQETMLLHLDSLLQEKENQLAEVRARWDHLVGEMRDARTTDGDEVDTSESAYRNLQTLVDKLEIMRWLTSKLVTPHTKSYDWLSDPHGRIGALKLARKVNTVEEFLES